MKENNLKMAQQDIDDALKTVEDLENFLNTDEVTEKVIKEKFLALNDKVKKLEDILISEGIL
ncbi:MAG: hypothetical protein ACI33J_01760 [Clostridium sp.]|nr:hypothetical protein [Clostridium sp.]MCI7443804.1 hypothetical protein [Clostridium sp.]MDY4078741.1 hypothetical protein [Clostridium sp.]